MASWSLGSQSMESYQPGASLGLASPDSTSRQFPRPCIPVTLIRMRRAPGNLAQSAVPQTYRPLMYPAIMPTLPGSTAGVVESSMSLMGGPFQPVVAAGAGVVQAGHNQAGCLIVGHHQGSPPSS